MGAILAVSRPAGGRHYFTAGTELRSGNVRGEELYRTATDEIYYRGSLDILGLFLQDEISLVRDRLDLVAGIRADMAGFHDGWQEVVNPSRKTGFTESSTQTAETANWQALSPKLSLQYRFQKEKSAYILAGTGFNPPRLDDLSRSGKIRKGFRLANPELLPEKLTNLEAGFKGSLSNEVYLTAAVYHSRGRDFHYLVATGDTIDAGGGSPRTVFRRENLSRVGINGLEISLDYHPFRLLSLSLAYSWNHSVITDDPSVEEGLEGKYLVEVPPHLLFAGLTWQYRFLVLHLNCQFTDAQWADDENRVLLEDYFLVNTRLEARFAKHFRIYLSCQNLFDAQFIDRKNQLSPGRFLLGGMRFSM
jgi:iron complex outermembrane receptor protein